MPTDTESKSGVATSCQQRQRECREQQHGELGDKSRSAASADAGSRGLARCREHRKQDCGCDRDEGGQHESRCVLRDANQ
jgi:hypothetical protein